MTIRWFTDADLAERARFMRERLEQVGRDELYFAIARWLAQRAGHDGPIYVPELTPQSEARLLQLLRGSEVARKTGG